MDYSESLKYLYSLGHEVAAAKYRLETITALLGELGNPQSSFNSVLIGGTNGKGSTAAMIEQIARLSGISTGLFTSPHLVQIQERVKTNGSEITAEDFARHTSMVRDAAFSLVSSGRLEGLPSFFEHVTAIAMSRFREAGVNLAVLEVGLGGRLDATNVVQPVVSVLTSISLDHQQVLGNSIAEIAAEKAPIIKTGSRAVISKQHYPEASEALMRRCLDADVLPVFTAEPVVRSVTPAGCFVFDYVSSRAEYSGIKCGLPGRHQLENAAAAIETAEIVTDEGFSLAREATVKGIQETRWPGRLEVIDSEPRILLDGAHNLAGAESLKEYLSQFCEEPITLIFAAMADKDIGGIAGQLFPLARTVVLTRVRDSRSASSTALAEHALSISNNVIFTESARQALSWARGVTGRAGLIVAAGSLYLIGELKRLLEEEDSQASFLRLAGPCKGDNGTRTY